MYTEQAGVTTVPESSVPVGTRIRVAPTSWRKGGRNSTARSLASRLPAGEPLYRYASPTEPAAFSMPTDALRPHLRSVSVSQRSR